MIQFSNCRLRPYCRPKPLPRNRSILPLCHVRHKCRPRKLHKHSPICRLTHSELMRKSLRGPIGSQSKIPVLTRSPSVSCHNMQVEVNHNTTSTLVSMRCLTRKMKEILTSIRHHCHHGRRRLRLTIEIWRTPNGAGPAGQQIHHELRVTMMEATHRINICHNPTHKHTTLTVRRVPYHLHKPCRFHHHQIHRRCKGNTRLYRGSTMTRSRTLHRMDMSRRHISIDSTRPVSYRSGMFRSHTRCRGIQEGDEMNLGHPFCRCYQHCASGRS